MSNLSRILAVKQGKRVALPTEVSSVIDVTDETSSVTYADAYEYTLRAEFKVKAQCFEEDLPDIMVAARRHVIHAVFGEFRGPIQRIYEKLFDRDIEGAMAALCALDEQMFGDEA